MNEYLNLKDTQDRNQVRMAGNIAKLGGGCLIGSTLARAGYNQANMLYNGHKIGKKYDSLLRDPFQGNGTDVVARMKNHNGEPVVLQRGEAIRGENGNIITSGRPLQHQTGTARNYGLNKGIYKHDIIREDAQRIPRIIQQKPVETNSYGQNVYITDSVNGKLRLVTSPIDEENIVSSIYYLDR